MSPPNLLPLSNDERYIPVATQEKEEEAYNCVNFEDEKIAAEKGDKVAEYESPVADETEVVIPPDGGWGWVVVAGSFMCNMIVDGIIFSFGMFLKDITTSLGATNAQVALVGSLLSGFYLIVGPFASALANRFGFRTVAILGSVVGSLAFGLSYFANSVDFLCVTYGILGGIGFGLIFVPAVITVGFYFERWRALATGIGVCGSGIGGFIFAPLSAYLVDELGWRNALLCQAAIILTCAIFGTTFRPVKPTKLKDLKNKEKPELMMDKELLPVATRNKMERILKLRAAESAASLNDSQGTIPKLFGVGNNASYPAASEVYHTISDPEPRVALLFSPEKRLSVPLIPEKDKPQIVKGMNGTNPVANGRRNSARRHRTDSESRNKSQKSLSDINRPIYRDDIFFGASLTRLPQYTSRTSVAYNLAVTRLPTENDIQEERKGKCKICPEAVRRTLATMLDISLLRSPSFLLMAISGFFTMMGFYVPFMYLKDRAMLSGIDEKTAVMMVSTIGIANTIGRLLSGVITSVPGVNALLVNNAALTIGGLATIMSGLSLTEEYQFTYSVVFGLSISCFASLRSILVVELMGLEKLTNAFGLLLLFQGVAACIGSPAAGAFMDATGSYDFSFYFSGIIILVSAIMCYPLNFVKRWEQRRNDTKKAMSVPI